LAFAGSLVWSVDGAPGGRWLIGLTAATLTVTLGLAGLSETGRSGEESVSASGSPGLPVSQSSATRLANELTSAAVLGTATTTLMGHSYLIAPTMSLTPLLRLLAGLFMALLLRIGLAAAVLWSWTAGHSLLNLKDETVLWLPLRWVVGLAAPLVLGWMAWEAA